MSNENEQTGPHDFEFAETLEEITDLSSWTETAPGGVQLHPVPPNVARMMQASGVSNEPSADAIPLTLASLRLVVAAAYPNDLMLDDIASMVNGEMVVGPARETSVLLVLNRGSVFRVHNNLGVAQLIEHDEQTNNASAVVEELLRSVFQSGEWKIKLAPEVAAEIVRLGLHESDMPPCVAIQAAQERGLWRPLAPILHDPEYKRGLDEGERDGQIIAQPPNTNGHTETKYLETRALMEECMYALVPTQFQLGYAHGFDLYAQRVASLQWIAGEPEKTFLFWRGTKPAHGYIAICGAHVPLWPARLGTLRMIIMNPQLRAWLTSAPTSETAGEQVEKIDAHMTCEAPAACRVCYYLERYPSIANEEPFYGIEAVGREAGGSNSDDGTGRLGHPEMCQPVIVAGAGEEIRTLIPPGVKPTLQPAVCHVCKRDQMSVDGKLQQHLKRGASRKSKDWCEGSGAATEITWGPPQ